MRKYTPVRIIYLCIIIIGLMGVTYAGWTDIGKMVANITTGFLNYNFEESGNSLVLVRNSSVIPIPASITVDRGKYLRIEILDAGAIMDMTYGDTLRIYYVLKNGEDGNVPLKAKEEDLGLISIDLKRETVSWNLTGGDYNAGDYINLLPENLGVYQVYHCFKARCGVIDLIPVHLPAKPVDSITYDYSKDLDIINNESAQEPQEIQEQTGVFDAVTYMMDEPDLSVATMGELISENETAAEEGVDLAVSSEYETSKKQIGEANIEESAKNMQDLNADNNKHRSEKNDKKKGKKIKKKLQVSSETISIFAEYSFIYNVYSIKDLVKVSDEIQKPILYERDDKELVKDFKFFVQNGEELYEYCVLNSIMQNYS